MIAKKALPLWLIPVLLVSGIGVAALAHYVWQYVIIPFEVKEPPRARSLDRYVVFEDDFEYYTVGTFPYSSGPRIYPYYGGWELWYEGAGAGLQIVVDFTSTSPTKSLQLLGWGIEGTKNHLAAVAAYPFVRGTETSLTYRVFAMTEEVCAFDSSVIVGFGKRVPEGVARCNEIRFRSDGMITTRIAGNEPIPLQSYEPNTWYEIEVVLNVTTDTFSVWIDGELKGSDFTTQFPSSEIRAFLLISNYPNVKVYFDDVTVCQIE